MPRYKSLIKTLYDIDKDKLLKSFRFRTPRFSESESYQQPESTPMADVDEKIYEDKTRFPDFHEAQPYRSQAEQTVEIQPAVHTPSPAQTPSPQETLPLEAEHDPLAGEYDPLVDRFLIQRWMSDMSDPASIDDSLEITRAIEEMSVAELDTELDAPLQADELMDEMIDEPFDDMDRDLEMRLDDPFFLGGP